VARVTRRLGEVEQALLRRWPENRLDPTLERISAVMDLLDNPQRRIPAIHVTSTNGKTTTSHVADELLRSTGRKVGRYTSPHLTSIDRIVVDGAPIDPGSFVEVYDEVLPAVEKVDRAGSVSMSFFEVVTAMAFLAFARAQVDAAVIEVGMGGTWGATNVVDGRVAVITPISLDHTELPRARRGHHRRREGRHHQAPCHRHARRPGIRRRAHAPGTRRERGRRGPARVRHRSPDRPGPPTRRAAPAPAQYDPPLPRAVPPAAGRTPGGQRRGGTRGGRGVPRGGR
jgi:hypothetical protein